MIKIVRFETLCTAAFILGVSQTVEALDNVTDVIELSIDNFEIELKKGPHLVMFYEPEYVLLNSIYGLIL